MADQGRTGRKDSSSRLWRPARALGTHAKQGPSTGHSAVGLRQAGNSLLTPRPHFTAPSCTLGNQVVRASDGTPFRQERRPTRVCRTPGPGSGLLAEASTPRAGRSCPWVATWRPWASKNRPLPLRDNNNNRVRETCSAPATPTSASSRSTDRVRRNHRVLPAANNHTSVDH
jgi:hypothetical protein